MLKFQVKTEFNLGKLNKIICDISQEHYIKVGILGSNISRKDEKSGLTNTEIGITHEYGSISKNIPERSFLRMPLFNKQKQIIEVAKNVIIKSISENKFDKISILKKIGKFSENVIREAFQTGGFGEWKPLSQKTIENKKGANKEKILIDTMQLRDSITSEIAN